ncbi:MAG: FG-GAP-like repeat-containing protein [Calditrichia bacterium]
MFRQTRENSTFPQLADCYGVAFRDVNDDSLPDLFVVRFREINRLLLNTPAGFQDYTIDTGLGGELMPLGQTNLELGASIADANNDGLPDVLTVGWGKTTRLYQQVDDMVFRDNARLTDFLTPLSGNGGVWADIDLDGDLDLFITDEHAANHLLLNNGNGLFDKADESYGISGVSQSQGATFSDFDGDGYPDLYVCNWFTPDILYRNVGGNHFEAMNLGLLHLQTSLSSNGVSAADIDNDGDMDILVSERSGYSRLYENNCDGKDWNFSDITESSGLENPYPSYGTLVADLNNDGWQDVFFTNIGPNQFFLGSDSGFFELAWEEAIRPNARSRSYSTGVAAADYDLDGDLDLFVACKDTQSVFYINPLNDNNSIRINLEGVQSNRDAFGTKVWLLNERSDTLAYREMSGGAGYLSIGEAALHFGVAPDVAYRAHILFPSGREKKLSNLRAGKRYSFSEASGIGKLSVRGRKWFQRLIAGKSFLRNSAMVLLLIALITGFLRVAFRRYNWQNRQTLLFFLVLLSTLYLLSLLFLRSSFTTLLLWQIGAALLVMGVTVVFMEQIRRLEIQRFGYRKVLKGFSEQVIFIKSNDELYEKLVTTVRDALGVTFARLYRAEDEVLLQHSSAGSAQMLPESLSRNASDSALLGKSAYLLEGEIKQNFPELFRKQTQLMIPLMSKDELAALLVLGPRSGKGDFPAGDLELLEILGRQAAIAIDNNKYIEESKALIQRLTEADLREKYVSELEDKNTSLETLYKELKNTQSQLIQSEKMGSLGQLVAGIAHELNNPISFIYANMKQLETYVEGINAVLAELGEDQHEHLPEKLRLKLDELDKSYDLKYIRKDIDELIDESLEGSQRVKDLVLNLRNFSRLDEAEFKTVNLHEGLDSSLKLLSNEFKNRIEVHRGYGQIPPVYCNPGQINQVFMNLLINAGQAISGKGDIWVRTEVVGDKVQIHVRDNGKGIPEDIRSKIFDPFFTTKDVGEGTGLGLSISYNIVTSHGGKIAVESEIGKGTEFIVSLPLGTSTDQ